LGRKKQTEGGSENCLQELGVKTGSPGRKKSERKKDKIEHLRAKDHRGGESKTAKALVHEKSKRAAR